MKIITQICKRIMACVLMLIMGTIAVPIFSAGLIAVILVFSFLMSVFFIIGSVYPLIPGTHLNLNTSTEDDSDDTNQS